MVVVAKGNFVRVSQTKVNRILAAITKKGVVENLNMLRLLPHDAAKVVYKVLKSASANAVENNKLNENDLVVTEAFSGPAAVMKRFQPMSKGRAGAIQKKLSHVTIKVAEKGAK